MQLSEFIDYLQELPGDLEVCFVTPVGEWWEVQGIVMYGTDAYAMIHLQPEEKRDPPLRRRPYYATLHPMYKKSHPQDYEIEKRNANQMQFAWLRRQEGLSLVSDDSNPQVDDPDKDDKAHGPVGDRAADPDK